MAVPYWQQQRAGISIAGDGAGSHDDFKPVQKGGSSVPSVQEHIEKLIILYMHHFSAKLHLLANNSEYPLSRASTIFLILMGKQDIKENAVLVYMKGVPEEPHCGFSAMVVRILDEHGTLNSLGLASNPVLEELPTIKQFEI
jgi:hypothetical protein